MPLEAGFSTGVFTSGFADRFRSQWKITRKLEDRPERSEHTIRSLIGGGRSSVDNQEYQKVARFFFWIVLSVLIVMILLTAKAKYADEKEFSQYAEKAQETNNPKECENIKNLRLSSLCYSQFVEAGYDCTGEEQRSDACLIAQGVATKDDLFCDMVFFDTKVPENLECRVSVFIERYSDEGLSDCCHIK